MKPWSENFSTQQDFVCQKLQYNNFEPSPGWPRSARYCYRPGVSLLRIRSNSPFDDDGETADVLEGYCLHGLLPPPDYPKPEHVKCFQNPKSWRCYSRDGTGLMANEGVQPDDDDEDEDRGTEARRRQVLLREYRRIMNRHCRHYVVSRVPVLPLPSLMPPSNLVEWNRDFCARMESHFSGDSLLSGMREAELHEYLASRST